MSNPNSPQRPRRLSIGDINIGDTQGASLGTSHGGEIRSRKREASLSGGSQNEYLEKSTSKSSNLPASASRRRKSSSNLTRSSKRKTPQGIERIWIQFLVFAYRYSWIVPLAAVSVVLLAWLLFAVIPGNSDSWLNNLILLSYPVEGTDPVLYSKGRYDALFVAYYSIVFLFIREFAMQVVLKPLAKRLGITGRHRLNRFLEQTYTILYYGVFGPLGLYIMYNSNMWYFNTRGFYEDFPHKTMSTLFKTFYLLQAAFWTQQMLVLILQLEKRRRDFKELVFHHIVTIALIFLSYRFHFQNMGLAIYLTMDISDFFLALSKTLNYVESVLTVPFFVFFVASWVYLRHYLNLVILKSILTEFVEIGSFELNWDTEQYKCWISQYVSFGLLAALQLVNFYWLVLILRILYRYAFHNIVGDSRSEGEEESDE